MAGGTGGHIFPGLALAEALRSKGWQVHWLGHPQGLEADLVKPRGFSFEAVAFSGLRGKGVLAWFWLPLRLIKAFWQSLQVVRRVQPDVLLGLGGYISFPGAMMGVLWGKPLVLHEQNSVAGMANRVLAHVADRVYTAFPGALRAVLSGSNKGQEWVGNPLRSEFINQPAPAQRFAGRSGPLRLVVVGGSLGAQVFNEVVPQALALLPKAQRLEVLHQSGARHLEAVRSRYQLAGVQAELTPFIEDTAVAFAKADVVLCRAGASTVTELAAVGVAALLVPFPYAVDDHQTANANFLTAQGAGQLIPQTGLTPQFLADLLSTLSRDKLQQWAENARRLAKLDAVDQLVRACEALAPAESRP
jgi:UDP-N-acetylglucosamine--N-acetylmuramyl-(pentapeptide) pyrophosphoryl-undecaprenol N-acetylglucosamine transferase